MISIIIKINKIMIIMIIMIMTKADNTMHHDHDHRHYHDHHDQVRSHRPGQEHCGDKAFVKLREEVS